MKGVMKPQQNRQYIEVLTPNMNSMSRQRFSKPVKTICKTLYLGYMYAGAFTRFIKKEEAVVSNQVKVYLRLKFYRNQLISYAVIS